MTIDDLRFWVMMATFVGGLGIAWGALRGEVKAHREQAYLWWKTHEKRDDERHLENRETLDEIRNDVKRINGKVAEHEGKLAHWAKPR